ncbi:unnamed protein product [Dibothriocephalus latus]|uniref:Uncharacterized protein n=1 Tax=Dibothriocephalus latus TaxID=60516 RepID=A0A3P7NKV4_DIBLA|nr:unnamed protein product [Dibothriocephalus latus]
MSWLGDHISSLKNQISTVTRDLLLEGTSEVKDYDAELKNANIVIRQQKEKLESYNNQVSALQNELNGLHLQIESLELENIHAREEYATLLREKEEQIQKLAAQTRLNGIEEAQEHSLISIPLFSTGASNLRSDSPDFASEDFLTSSSPRLPHSDANFAHQTFSSSEANAAQGRIRQHFHQAKELTTDERKKVDLCVQTEMEDSSAGPTAVSDSHNDSADAIVDQLMAELDSYDFFKNNDFSVFSTSATNGAPHTKLEQFLTRLRTGLDRITELYAFCSLFRVMPKVFSLNRSFPLP